MWPLNISVLPPPVPAPGAERVRAAVLDLLPLHLQAELLVERDHQLGHALLVAGEAVHVDQRARRLDEPVRRSMRTLTASVVGDILSTFRNVREDLLAEQRGSARGGPRPTARA